MPFTPEERKQRRRESKRREYRKNAERYKQRSREYNAKNKERKAAYMKERYVRRRATQREQVIFRQFKLTTDQFNALLAKQENRCAICAKHFVTDMLEYGDRKKSNRPHIDHDHATGKVRGLLCPACNLGIGYFSDNVATLINAACYLEKPPNG